MNSRSPSGAPNDQQQVKCTQGNEHAREAQERSCEPIRVGTMVDHQG